MSRNGSIGCPPCAESPFALSRRYPFRSGLSPCWATSEDVTPPSSLLRAHAPDHPPPSAFSLSLGDESSQVAASPCWTMALPDVISADCPYVPEPILRWLPRCFCPLLPAEHRPSPRCNRVGAQQWPAKQLLGEFGNFGAVAIRFCSGPQVCSPHWLLPPCGPLHSGCDFYVRAPHDSLPPRVPDMLAVRTGQLTAGGFHPFSPQPCRLLLQRPRSPQAAVDSELVML